MCFHGRRKSLVADDSGVAGAVESAGGDMDPVVMGLLEILPELNNRGLALNPRQKARKFLSLIHFRGILRSNLWRGSVRHERDKNKVLYRMRVPEYYA
jgi:hypothetical protein